MGDNAPPSTGPKQPYWVIYLGLLLAGILMLAEAADYHPLEKITAKLSLGLLYSAVALYVGDGRAPGYIGTVIIWAAIIVSFLTR
jgi:LPXTG-motif cell wall-anchored protein